VLLLAAALANHDTAHHVPTEPDLVSRVIIKSCSG